MNKPLDPAEEAKEKAMTDYMVDFLTLKLGLISSLTPQSAKIGRTFEIKVT